MDRVGEIVRAPTRGQAARSVYLYIVPPENFSRNTMLGADFFTRHPLVCAAEFIGCELVWEHCSGTIVETEAYTALGDEACHTFLRRGAQLFVDTHPPGTAYIYLNYGMHWLVNVLVKHAANDGFVLIRALEPRHGLPLMRGAPQADRRRATFAQDRASSRRRSGSRPPRMAHSLCHDPQHAFHARPTDAAAAGDRHRCADRHFARGGFSVAVSAEGQPLREPPARSGLARLAGDPLTLMPGA